MKKKIKHILAFSTLLNGLVVSSFTQLFAQVYTFDYLTYADRAHDDENTFLHGTLTSFVFWGKNEYDESGRILMNNPISYTEFYGYLAYRAIANDFLEIFFVPQIGGFHAMGAATYTWGTPWLYGKFTFSNVPALQARFGVKLAEIGETFRRKDTEIDLGILYHQTLNGSSFDAGLSYRIRQKDDLSGLPNFGGRYNQAGNEIHYKLEVARKLGKAVSLAALAMGYHSGDKKLDGVVLPDSHSRKTTLGASLQLQTKSSGFFELGIVWDVAGRYDKKGFAVVFNVTE